MGFFFLFWVNVYLNVRKYYFDIKWLYVKIFFDVFSVVSVYNFWDDFNYVNRLSDI